MDVKAEKLYLIEQLARLQDAKIIQQNNQYPIFNQNKQNLLPNGN